ncbi:Ku70-binding family protein [Perilla frutescens var. frutescens]|nr:Ku70-binding family protein [Perilla frutescens var. frutescens]
MEDVRILITLLRNRKANRSPCGGVTAAECRRMMQKSLENPKVKILMEKMKKRGCSIKSNKFFKPAICDSLSAGAGGCFTPGEGIYVCCNNIKTQDDVTQLMIHELIHAYDECRAKNLDWKNCYHQACAEIRAYALGGQCHYLREYFRGYTNLRGHEQECVKRLTTLSARANPNCSEYMIKMAIDAIWETCYNDKSPFDNSSDTT